MVTFKKEWSLETAMEILQHPTVDSEIWAEAVEWLLIYGPPEIQDLLQQASGHATGKSFPRLQPEGYTQEGVACYSVSDVAASLDIPEEEAAKIIAEKEKKHGVQHLFDQVETNKLQ